MTKIEKAQEFAHTAHDMAKQVRKYTLEPYWVHTDEVAAIVARVGGDEDMQVAAHLHDVLEDVFPIFKQYDVQWMAKEFGLRATNFVVELTDVYTKEAWPDHNRQHRKQLENARIGRTTPQVKTIKLADLISNSKSIVQHDKDFARVYLKEKFNMLPLLLEGDNALMQEATSQVIAGYAVIGMQIPRLN